MKILLTGGSGFLGRNIRERLAPVHEVVAPTHRELDVTDSAGVSATLQRGRFDAVIHAAIEGGSGVLESTLRGYWNLARESGRVDRIVYFGSGAEYSKDRDLHKIGEERIGDRVPPDAYGLAKLACNTHARASANIFNLRLFGVYGRHEGYLFRFISNSIAKAMLGIPIDVRQNVVFDYLYIDDLLALLPSFLQSDLPARDFNVTPDDSISLEQILGHIQTALASPIEYRFRSEGMNFAYTGANHRLREAVPNASFTNYAEGIRRLVGFYESCRAEIDKDALLRNDYLARCHARPAESIGEVS